MAHPAFRSLGITDAPPDFKLGGDLHGQADALENPQGAMVHRRAFAQIHAVEFQADVARHAQARGAADLLGLRNRDESHTGRGDRDTEPRQAIHRAYKAKLPHQSERLPSFARIA